MKIKNKINHFLTNDLVFKIFFTNNEYMLKKLISMSIGIRYEDITNIKILNTEIVGENDDSKIGRLDLLVEINNKELINIEIQNADKYNLPQRIEYYLSRIYVNNIKMGEDYINLNKVYGIYILDYNDKNDMNPVSWTKRETRFYYVKIKI